MNGILLGLGYLAAVNPPRTRLGLPEGPGRRADAAMVGLGAVIALGVVLGIGWASGPVLDALQITPETFRIAAGAVALVAGLAALWKSRPGAEPALDGWRAAIWPVAFPRLLAPEVAALALTTGSKEGVTATVVAAAVALVTVVALAGVRRTEMGDGVLEWTGRLLAMALVAVGVFLMIDGISDV
jgi:small neutral amino acid transporter SnatA (MarC family)